MPTTRLKNMLYRAALPFCAPGCGPRPVSGVTGHPLSRPRQFERLVRRHHVLGSATLIVAGGQSALVCTSSRKPEHIAAPDTFFRVASITKTATAMLAMRMADEGLLDPDAPAGAYFRDASAASALEGITLRHLLSHTSGLLDPPDLETAMTAGKPFPDLVPSARRVAPGQAFHYSNLGFGLIGCIMEAVLDKPVGEVFRDRLFTPLGMESTLEGCLLPADRIMPVSRVLPYRGGSGLVLTSLGSVPLRSADPLSHYGHTAGSMYTDIASLRKMLDVLIGNGPAFLSESALKDMKAQHACYGSLSPTLSYGLGLLRIRDPSVSPGLVLGHQGFAYGCADGAFWEEATGRIMITLNGGCSEARNGRLGLANRDFLRWAFRKELPSW